MANLHNSPWFCARIARSQATAVSFTMKSMAKWKSKSAIDCSRDFWNHGLTTEAARAARDHGFRDLKLEYVISLIHPENQASRRVAEKNGMILEKETTFRGFPTFVFAITRTQWMKLRGDGEV
jgi:RimJ/RimL family protein N-acetyltransferase